MLPSIGTRDYTLGTTGFEDGAVRRASQEAVMAPGQTGPEREARQGQQGWTRRARREDTELRDISKGRAARKGAQVVVEHERE